MTHLDLEKDLRRLVDRQRAKALQRFFKTGKGEYGEGDKFLGLTVSQIRETVKRYLTLSLDDIQLLLRSTTHEMRLAALLILVKQFKKADQQAKKRIFDFYLANTKHINNWDLVDLTAPNIIGEYLLDTGGDKQILYRLARSPNLWERRISLLATLALIKYKSFNDALKITEILLRDQSDLIHKAAGWMLREIGKRDRGVEKRFLDKHAGEMPRTMLRYSLEKFNAEERKKYLEKKRKKSDFTS